MTGIGLLLALAGALIGFLRADVALIVAAVVLALASALRQRGGGHAASVAVAAVLAAGATAGHAEAAGGVRVFAHVPYPGNPGGLAVDGGTLWVTTSAASLDRPFDGDSSVFAYDLGTGRPAARRPNPIVVPKNPVALMGLAGIALDADGRQYVGDMNGQVVRIDPRTAKSEVYATVPTSTQTSVTDMPTFDAFGPDGSLYVGDAGGQPIIWRVPPGGGQAEPWFVDPRLMGSYGASIDGLTVDPSGRDLYFAAGNQQPKITVYRLPLAHPDASHLEAFHDYTDVVMSPCPADPAKAADPNAGLAAINCVATQLVGAGGLAFGRSGRLYVAFLAKNQISILGPDGSERARFPSPDENMKLDVPFNGPFGLAFDGRGGLLVANVGDPTLSYWPGHTPPPGGLPDSKSWAVLDWSVGDTAARLYRPRIP